MRNIEHLNIGDFVELRYALDFDICRIVEKNYSSELGTTTILVDDGLGKKFSITYDDTTDSWESETGETIVSVEVCDWL